MTTNQHATIARADVVGSLLRPTYLRQAREGARQGQVSDAKLKAAEDRAVREVIAYQEGIGLDVITDGEMRREGWNAQGGYEAIAAALFPRLDVDVLLLEYDTPRAGDFSPLRHVLPQHHVVLGLLTTKHGQLEEAAMLEARIHEAAAYVPLERLALSPQCGFASVEAGNPISPQAQEVKLRLVVQMARRVWS